MAKGRRQKKKKGFPTIVSLLHYYFMGPNQEFRDSSKKLLKFLDTFSRGPKQERTLFIEGSTDTVNALLSRESVSDRDFYDLNPFFDAVQFAKKNGWKIVPLDKNSADKLSHSSQMNVNHSETLQEKRLKHSMIKYSENNLRPRHWVRVTQNAGKGDLIVMFPTHVRDFLIESRMSAKNVFWINRPAPLKGMDPNFLYFRRLNSKKRRWLKRRKDELREQRRKNIAAKKHKPRTK